MRDNILKDVYANDKIELSSIEVKLGTFADVKQQLEKAESSYNTVLDYSNKIYAIKQEAKKNTNVDTLFKISTELESDRDDFIAKVNALGIDASKIPQPKQYADAISKIISLANKSKEMIIAFNK